GSISNAQGSFTIDAALPPGQYTVEYTFIGRRTTTKTVTLGTERAIALGTMALPETALQLEQIVVTGPGAAAERRARGYSVSTVIAEQVNRAAATASAGVAMQGKITGAAISQVNGQPGGAVTIRLRGTNAILGSAEPLLVIDGILVDNSTDALVSISSNTSGANRSGGAMSNRLSDINPADIERIEILKGAAAAALYGSRAKNGVIQIFTKRGTAGPARFTWSSELQVNSTPKKYELNMAPKAGIADLAVLNSTLYQSQPELQGLKIGDPVTRYDYQDQIWQTGIGTNNQLTVTGGTGGTTYYLSALYRDDQGIVKTSAANRYSVRANLTQQLGNNIELTAGGSYIRSHTNFVIEGEQTNGVLTSVIFTPTIFNPAFSGSIGRYPYNPALGPNPLDILANWDSPEDLSRFVGNIDLTYHPTSYLGIRYLFGYDDYRQEDRLFIPPQAVSASYTGSVSNPVRMTTNINHDLTATLDTRLGAATKLQTLAGMRYTQSKNNTVYSSGSSLSPGQILVGGAIQAASQSQTELRTSGFFVQEQVGIAERLFLTGGLNYEASSAFGENQRWQLFKRLGTSYLVSQSPGWKDGRLGAIMPTLRLRAAYGETGGQPPTLYDRFANYLATSFSGKAGLVPSTVAANPDLKPERQREIEAGIDVGILDDRVSLEATYYNKSTKDFVLGVPLPLSSGFTTQRQNIGETSDHGFELTLNTINVAREKWSWRTRLGAAFDRSKVTKLVTSRDTILYGYLNYLIEGQPVGVFYGGQYRRDADGKVMYIAKTVPGQTSPVMLPLKLTVNADGTGTAVNGIIGDPNPDWTGSLLNTVTIGNNLELGILLDGRFGNDVANFTRRISEYFGADKSAEREIMGDTIPGTYSRNTTARISTYEEYIEDGSYVKLRELSASYRVDQPWVTRLGISSLRVRVAGRNLYTWTNYTGLDPEVNLFGTSQVAQGVDFANTPIPRSWVVGIDLGF
ncbi:MAG: SusC/RagA family TonB-linked outer membrane protein, partial [Gemmatimonadetes bacterium]|nr:SusC/RagA family TonB-linked outer membrane protein [Gemmatimonadota bacterium]